MDNKSKSKVTDKEHYTRFVLVVENDVHEKVRELSKNERASMQQIYLKAVDAYLKKTKK
jgi:hypothetical protein